MKTLHEINAEGKTIVVVTHDMEVAKAAKKQFYIEDGDGRIKEWKASWIYIDWWIYFLDFVVAKSRK